jgi:hypothetical protein
MDPIGTNKGNIFLNPQQGVVANENENHIERLPTELIQYIFLHLELLDLCRLAGVSRRFSACTAYPLQTRILQKWPYTTKSTAIGASAEDVLPLLKIVKTCMLGQYTFLNPKHEPKFLGREEILSLGCIDGALSIYISPRTDGGIIRETVIQSILKFCGPLLPQIIYGKKIDSETVDENAEMPMLDCRFFDAYILSVNLDGTLQILHEETEELLREYRLFFPDDYDHPHVAVGDYFFDGSKFVCIIKYDNGIEEIAILDFLEPC